MKVVLILVDGMRPDALLKTEGVQELLDAGASCLQGVTVMPSVTLPCHISLFHSVDPSRHGTTTNTYAPQVRPITGLFEVLKMFKKDAATFYSWEQLRDISRPGSLSFSKFIRGSRCGWDLANDLLTTEAIELLQAEQPDFLFLYLGSPDESGHAHGWMGSEYMASMKNSIDNIHRVLAKLPEDYVMMICADHGGHDRTHGTDMPEDMTIPVIAIGGPFVPGSQLGQVSIKDIAPTVAKLTGVPADEDWEGKCLY